MKSQHDIAVFGGGCFWCTEAVFKELKGIVSVMPGYAGGHVLNPTYEQVSGGETGHVEAIRIEFDPLQITFQDLLTVFFATHDPSTPNRQGNDVGPQYRSVIFYTDEQQKKESEKFIRQLNTSHPDGAPVVTTIEPLEQFYEAEDYHRDYFAKNRGNSYCQLVINPKLEKVQQQFAQLLKTL